MIIYNTTYHIDKQILEEVLRYLKEIYIPQAVESGFLQSPHLSRVMNTPEEEGTGIALQFHVKNQETLHYWLEHEGRSYHQQLSKKFGEKILGFVTLLEELDWKK
jgi:hypothetical protein